MHGFGDFILFLNIQQNQVVMLKKEPFANNPCTGYPQNFKRLACLPPPAPEAANPWPVAALHSTPEHGRSALQ